MPSDHASAATLLETSLASIAGLAAGAFAVASIARPESQFFGPTLVAGHDPRQFALTFDDGPNGDTTLRLLDLLARHNTRATFFLVGQHVAVQPEIVRAIAAAGHLIGNHTWTHPWLVNHSMRTVRDELRRTQTALEDILGAPVRYFRPPHGARHWGVLRAARELHLTTVQWNAMGLDWLAIPPDRIVANVDRGLRRATRQGRGANILLHDGDGLSLGADRSATLEATDLLLTRLTQQGLRPVTVDAWG